MAEQQSATEADFIVIGAGSAGCAVAARLSEDPATRVALIEAGGEDKNRWIHIPLGFGKTFAETMAANRPGSILYALGMTQHTTGVQGIRSFTILQLLLGNIGKPGGGVIGLKRFFEILRSAPAEQDDRDVEQEGDAERAACIRDRDGADRAGHDLAAKHHKQQDRCRRGASRRQERGRQRRPRHRRADREAGRSRAEAARAWRSLVIDCLTTRPTLFSPP